MFNMRLILDCETLSLLSNFFCAIYIIYESFITRLQTSLSELVVPTSSDSLLLQVAVKGICDNTCH